LPHLLRGNVQAENEDEASSCFMKQLMKAVSAASGSPRSLLHSHLGDTSGWCDSQDTGVIVEALDSVEPTAALQHRGDIAEPMDALAGDMESVTDDAGTAEQLELCATRAPLESVPEEGESLVSCSGSRSSTSRGAAASSKAFLTPVFDDKASFDSIASTSSARHFHSDDKACGELVINPLPPPMQARCRSSSSSSTSLDGRSASTATISGSYAHERRQGGESCSSGSSSGDPFERAAIWRAALGGSSPAPLALAAKSAVAVAEPLWSLPGLPACDGTPEDMEDRERVKVFLTANGFAGPRAGRRRLGRTTYPLHAAVRGKDAHMVSLLLRWGAESSQTDSAGRTPLELAFKRDWNGSMSKVIDALVTAAPATGGRTPPL